MKTKSLLLLIVFLGSIIPVSSAGAENPAQRIFDDSVALLHASRSILLDEQDISGTSRAPGEMLVVKPAPQTDVRDTALANLIQATKDQRNALDASCSQLKEVYSTSDRKCERQVLEDYCSSQKEKLNTRLGFLHKLRGDRRKLFTRIWHGIKRSGDNVWSAVGPVGRRLLRRVGPEVLEVVLSGGTLSGGMLRKILFKEARNIGKGELERLLTSGVERLMAGQAAFASKQPFVVAAAKVWKEPKETNAARRTNDSKLRKAAAQSIVIAVEHMHSRTKIAGNILRLVPLA